MEQKELIQQLKNGFEQAYEAMFKIYYTELVMHANRYLYDFEASKEIVQDLFVHIYEKRHNLDINASLKSYLYRSVQNRCINQINSTKTKEKYINHIKQSADKDENKIEQGIVASEIEIALYKAISDLPPKCRMIFKMNRFDGLSNGEIADRLELSKRTVETQITKALKILREKLKNFSTYATGILILMGFIIS